MPKQRYHLPEGEQIQGKPLVFGTDPLTDERLDDFQYAQQHFGAFYVPGYSEARSENDLRARDGKPPIPLPRLQWIRIKRRDGSTYVNETDEGMIEYSKLGYKAMGRDDLENFGFGWPPAAGDRPNSDGLICIGDLALFFVDEDRASRNLRQREHDIQETEQSALMKEVEVSNRDRGKFEPLPDERTDEEGKFFIGDANVPNL